MERHLFENLQLQPLLQGAALLFSILVLAACSSAIPPEISNQPESAPTLAEVRENPNQYLDSRVRWGGMILRTENADKTSRVTVIALPLNASGRPEQSDTSPGRFIAIVDEFLEPLLYSGERMITFTGRVAGVETQQVGNYPYDYALLKVEHFYLWPKLAKLPDYDYPYYRPYYPWYHPWYYPRYPSQLIPTPR